jgi:hypothetical protein
MRLLAWLVVLGLFAFSGLCFASSSQIAGIAAPQERASMGRASAVSVFVPRQAIETLTYLGQQCNPASIGVVLGFASAGLGVLCLVILAATPRRRRATDAGEDGEVPEVDDMIDRIRRL